MVFKVLRRGKGVACALFEAFVFGNGTVTSRMFLRFYSFDSIFYQARCAYFEGLLFRYVLLIPPLLVLFLRRLLP
jgi:hypothetical protein